MRASLSLSDAGDMCPFDKWGCRVFVQLLKALCSALCLPTHEAVVAQMNPPGMHVLLSAEGCVWSCVICAYESLSGLCTYVTALFCVCRFTTCRSPLNWCRTEVWSGQSPDQRVGCAFLTFMLCIFNPYCRLWMWQYESKLLKLQ